MIKADSGGGAAGGSPQRAFTPVAERALVIGLDGATFTSLNPLMEEGRMPRLKSIVDAGARGTCYSTIPPMTPAAWTTFLTGKQPGTHGILDFEAYDIATGLLRLNSAQRLQHVRNIWQILSEKNFRVGSVNVPMTYPPVPVNGFVITGFETPGPESEFAYPPSLRKDILDRWPDPTLKSKWRKQSGAGDDTFKQNIAYLSNSFHQGAAMTTWLGDHYGWDALMVVFKLIDNLQHKTWKYIDPRWSDRNPARRDMVKGCFEEADKAVGVLLDYAKAHNAAVMMVSDHGHGSLEGKVYPNRLLEKWGYLKLRGLPSRMSTRAREILGHLNPKRGPHVSHKDITHHLPLVLSETKAVVMHAGNAGFLYLNLKGRQPTGIVDPKDYDSVREDLIRRFRGPDCRVRTPSGAEIELFPKVYKPEEIYNVSREDQPWLPDLLLMQHETLAAVRRMRGRHVNQWLPYRRMEGTHRMEGIFIAGGPGIRHTNGVTTQLADCAPTLLAMLGVHVPDDMQGRVLTEIFETAPTVEKERAKSAASVPVGGEGSAAEDVFSAEDIQKVTERLSDLGYLE